MSWDDLKQRLRVVFGKEAATYEVEYDENQDFGTRQTKFSLKLTYLQGFSEMCGV